MDRIVTPEINLLGKTFSKYFFFVGVGLTCAISLAMVLASLTGTSHAMIMIVICINVIVLLTLAMLTKIILGGERYTFYHYMILVMLSTPVILNAIGKAVFPVQDIITIVLILNLAVGRMGCFMVGCCHGKPSRWGVVYGEKHAHAGFTPFYFGIRIFPLPLLELVLAFVAVSAGVWILLHQLPGNACAWMIISYSLIRYVLEYFRGDSGRPFWKGFSEAQWTSLALMIAVVVIEYMGWLSFHAWHVMVVAATIVSMVVVVFIRRSAAAKRHLLLNPNHIKELSDLVYRLSNELNNNVNVVWHETIKPGDIKVGCTSLGIQVSLGALSSANDFIHHYSFSWQKKVMNNETAKTLADLVLRLWYPSCKNELIDSKKGIYHLLINQPQ
jgi:hypothetical protein